MTWLNCYIFCEKKILDKIKNIGYNHYCLLTNGIIAQLGEHLPYKQRVIGSSPIGPIYGGIAQLARAHGSYPWCRWFKSSSRSSGFEGALEGTFLYYKKNIFGDTITSIIR